MVDKKSIIDYFKEYEELKLEFVPRELKVPLDSNFIISIIGPRRAGKTYFLRAIQLKHRNAAYLNFEDTRLMEIKGKDLRKIINIFTELYGREPEYLLLDEIHNIEMWQHAVRELYELKKYKIFITGSSSKLLSKEIATQLRGRSLSYLLLPFSFREFLLLKKVKVEKYMSKVKEAKIKNLLLEYLEFGGFPDVIKNKEKTKILKEYLDLILFRDFIERHRIRNVELARALQAMVIQNFAKEVSVSKIFNKLKPSVSIAKDTVYEYITKLEDTSFFFFLKKFSFKAHIRELWPKKIYICDTGLTKVVRYFEDIGRRMENAVFLELLRKTNEKPLMELYYWKDYSGKEVDFVIKEGVRVRELVQVTYASGLDEVEKRELRSLVKASELFKCKNLRVITWDLEDKVEFKGKKIEFVPLWKWLLRI